MYTQCPDCGTPFRVTAEVLKQAAGQVRCGGCSNAFNALEFLSETVPQQPPANDASFPVPELTPELLPDPGQIGDSLPKSISAERSAALLKTLDQLAGSDIRIEDTGVEWRVLDDDEVAAPAAADEVEEHLDATPTPVDEPLDATPTPVDELLVEAPEIVEAEEIFEKSANELGKTAVDEIRFDDNTPLPDDVDLGDESSYSPVAPESTVDEEPLDARTEPQPDITLSDPEEWDDILGEFAELSERLSGANPADEMANEAAPEADPVPEQAESDHDDTPFETQDTEPGTASDVLDIDTQFSLQAEAMGIDLTGSHALDDSSEPAGIESDELVLDNVEDEDSEAKDLEAEEIELYEEDSDDDMPEDIEVDIDSNKLVSAFDESKDPLQLIEEPIVAQHSIEDELAALKEADFEDDDVSPPPLVDTSDVETETDTAGEHHFASLSAEEQSINRMIDQELMALAIEDEDGFASTIIVPEDTFVADPPGESDGVESDQKAVDSTSTQAKLHDSSRFESIVMEGESVQSASDIDKHEADNTIEPLTIAPIEEAPEPPSQRKRYGIIGGITALALLLAVQAIHQYRELLATIPAIGSAISPIYRVLGQPLQPEWDIKGWRFEATKGNTDLSIQDNTESDNELITIYSRVGNKSDAALPYPLIGISLTDRFEETIGSRILEPAEYLLEDIDPRKLVRPGDKFNAVISIKTPSKDTTGFKLNVCYRMSDDNLRCAIDDFK